MAEATPINIPDFTEDQPLKPATGRVWINAKGHATVTGSSAGIEVNASVVVEGLKEGEYVRFWWINEWKRDGQDDRSEGGRPHVTLHYHAGDPAPGVQVCYARGLPKADSGWTACLRLVYSTNSETAKITRREFDGWRLP